MKTLAIAIVVLLAASPSYAQLGALKKKVQQAEDAKAKVDKYDIRMSDKEERELGEKVSQKLRTDFGVVQDAAVTKYVSLVGTVVAQASSRPNLDWQFIVLDTDGVNAYAAPGGLVHITRGALGLCKNEAELAGVLGHEITHITAKHTVRAIQKAKTIELAGEQSGSGITGEVMQKLVEQSYKIIFENSFNRDDELESDKVGVQLANKVGYKADALAAVLTKIADRNKGVEQPNGMFASHPRTTERISEINKLVKAEKLNASATVASRYSSNIKFDVKPAAEIAIVDRGARGLSGGSTAKPESKDEKKDAKKDDPKKTGGTMSGLTLTKGSQSQNSQTVASAGARGVGTPDRDAKGGDNPNRVKITLTPAEIAQFKSGIA
jgi:predicted Zn-dependent protease